MSGPPAILALFDIGPLEFMVLIGAAIMLFGGDLPDVARKAGATVRKLRNLANEAARNLDVPANLSRLPGAAEFKEGLESKDEPARVDLAKEIDIDWREVARLPEPGSGTPSAPAPPSAPDAATREASTDAKPGAGGDAGAA